MRAVLGWIARSWWTRAVVTAAILLYLSRQIDMPSAGRALISVRLPLLCAVLGLVALDRAVMIGRWVLLVRASGTAISTGAAARIFLVSSFVGSFLPAGFGGDAARAWGLSRHTSEGSQAMASVAVDRLLGVLSLALVGLLSAAVWVPLIGSSSALIGATGLLTAGLVVAFWADRWVRVLVPTDRRQGWAARQLLGLGDAMGAYRSRRGVLGRVMAWSIVVQLLRIVQAYLLALGLSLQVPFWYFLVFMPAGLLILLLPISISGFGLPQGAIVWMLRPAGVPDEQSFALSTLIILTGLAGNLPGLWLWMSARGTPRPPV